MFFLVLRGSQAVAEMQGLPGEDLRGSSVGKALLEGVVDSSPLDDLQETVDGARIHQRVIPSGPHIIGGRVEE